MATEIKLRDYQSEAENGCREAFIRGEQPVLLVMPTGSGKTFTFSHITMKAAGNGNPVIIIVHRKELLLQASASLRALGIEHGMISPHFTPDPRQLVQVASVDTLLTRIGGKSWRYPKFRLAIFDEAHHCVADNKWGRAYEALGRPAMLGVTATPIRTDGKGLGIKGGGLFETMVLGPSVPWLVEQGMLLNPIVYTSLEMPDLSGLRKKKDGEYSDKQLADRVDRPRITGSAVEQYKKICPGVRTVVFCTNIQHAKHVVDEFNAAGFKFALLVGEPAMKDGERTKVNNQLRRGELHGAVTVDLVSEGYDLPDLECCIMLRPTMSEALFLQQVGRIMRPAEGKERCWLLDHVGNVGAVIDGHFTPKHGLPDQEREWSLAGRVKRKGAKKAAEETVELMQCPKCWLVHEPAPKCPRCEHVYEVKARQIEQVDGELVELTPERQAQLKLKRRREVKDAKSLAELQRIEAERGYKPGWAQHTFEAKQKKRARFQARPPEPTREEMLTMSLEQLQRVEHEQGWPPGTASQFYYDNHHSEEVF